jgi:hypothetical protein
MLCLGGANVIKHRLGLAGWNPHPTNFTLCVHSAAQPSLGSLAHTRSPPRDDCCTRCPARTTKRHARLRTTCAFSTRTRASTKA